MLAARPDLLCIIGYCFLCDTDNSSDMETRHLAFPIVLKATAQANV